MHLPPARTLLPGGEAAGVRVAIDRQARLVAPQHVRLGRRLAQCQVFHCKQIISQRLFDMFRYDVEYLVTANWYDLIIVGDV